LGLTHAALVVALLMGGCPSKPAEQPEEPPRDTVVDRAMSFYETRASYEQPVVATVVPQGLVDLRAETCGACHEAIYQEWAVSTHRRAWLDDAQFQKELAKSSGADDPARGGVSWLCVNCHTPVAAQLEKLVVGLTDERIERPEYVTNPTFDEALQHDSVTCATCHVRNGIVYGRTETPKRRTSRARTRTS
jgi:hypothetical protein